MESLVPPSMDFEESPYTSCIRIGKRSILPPVMTDERREEMRYYRELAVTLEKHHRLRKKRCRSVDSGVMISNSDSSICRKTTEVDQLDYFSPTAKSEGFVDMNDESNVSIVMNESPLAGGSMIARNAPRERRDSYTLETPSPIMLQYMKANEKYDELLIEMTDCSDSSTVVNEEIPINVPIEELSSDGITLQTEKLTLQDLETLDPANSSETWNANECTYGCDDIEQFVMHTRRLKAFSLPSTSHTSPICPRKTSAPDQCLKDEYDNLVKNKPAANFSKINDTSEDYEAHESSSISEMNGNYCRGNDSVSKYVESIDLNSSASANMSFESEFCGRESIYSNCSSVSLNKFLTDVRQAELDESTCLNNYLQMKEQLELKHRNELMKLLREQEQENNYLEQYVRISNTSSPKTNYAYSKEVVLKKYSADSSPSPILMKHSPESDAQRFGGTINCRRRLCDSESGKPNQIDSQDVPVTTIPTAASHENMQDFEARVRAATKINAAVRGYFIRRLFKAERVQHLLQTINDCLITAISLQKESDLKPAELSLQTRVLQQSITAQNEIHEIFALPIAKQLEIIAADRDLKNRSLQRKSRTPLPLSEATQKTIERRKSLSCGSQTPKNSVRKRCKSVSSIRSDSNVKREAAPAKSKTKAKISHTVPRFARRFWR